MPVVHSERIGSRTTRADDKTTTVELLYHIYGTNDELTARVELINASPFIYYDPINVVTLVRREQSVEQIGDQLWQGSIQYTPSKNAAFSFDTTGGTQHIQQSYETRCYSVQAGGRDTANDDLHNHGINVTEDSVEGCDVVIPALKFTETHDFAATFVTPSFVATLASLSGFVNQQQWRQYAPGTVLFHGATGASQDDGMVPITYNFEVSSSGVIAIPGIGNVDKSGWEYLWCRYAKDAQTTSGNNIVVQKPTYVMVETIYLPADFGGLGI